VATRYRLVIPRDLYESLLVQARFELPNECCGLLAGRVVGEIGRVTLRLPLVNVAASPKEFLSEPRSMLQAEKQMRAGGLDLLAVYHSHPTSPPTPSRTDLERNIHGVGVMHLIISLEKSQPEMRGWWLLETVADPAEWEFTG
jgi:proteasome lid subunit RPN8/RPN11